MVRWLRFVISDHLALADPLVERFEGWARRSLAHGSSLADEARAVGTSDRTLAGRRADRLRQWRDLAYAAAAQDRARCT